MISFLIQPARRASRGRGLSAAPRGRRVMARGSFRPYGAERRLRVLVVGDRLQALLERVERPSDPPGGLGQALGSEDEHRDPENDGHLRESYVGHRVFLSESLSGLYCP